MIYLGKKSVNCRIARYGESCIFDGFLAGVVPGSQHTIFLAREAAFRRTQGKSEEAIATGASADRRLPHSRVISLRRVAPAASAQ
jgi:hypothetical protein